jgi:PHD/YefM family antitoxin component YafN of YafNO toxin-antitoxin module
MNTINASDLKTQGINAIAMALADTQEVAISVQGKPRFIVMDIDHYQQLREYELEIAAQKANADIVAGQFVTESANDYMNRIIKEYDLQADYS